MLNVGSTEASFKEYTSNQKGQHRLAHSLCLNDRFGSLAALQDTTTPMSAIGGKAAIRRPVFASLSLNVCFYRKRTFKSLEVD